MQNIKKMAKSTVNVIISIGSNTNQEHNVKQGKTILSRLLHNAEYSRFVWTEPIGMSNTCKFLNGLCFATTSLSYDKLEAMLKLTERELGRKPEDKNAGIVILDLDILLYCNQQRRFSDWERPYVKQLISEYKNREGMSNEINEIEI